MAESQIASVISPAVEPAEARQSGVSWPAVFAGAAVTAAIGSTLMTRGAGMGISSVSVWPSRSASGTIETGGL